MGPFSLPDSSRLPPAISQGRTTAVSFGGDAANPLAAAVVHAVSAADGGDADRYPPLRRFAGIELIDGRIPDETTILNFRHLLEEHQIAEQVLKRVNQS